MKMFQKLFCPHKWIVHAKQKYEETNSSPSIHGGRVTDKISFTREVLICEKCGKIKKIEY